MTDLKKSAQQALEALETKGEHHPRVYRAIEALRAALAEPACCCGEPSAPGIVHRTDGPCYMAEPNRAQAMRDAGYTRRPTLREMAEQGQEPVAWLWGHQIDDLKHYGYKPDMRAWTTEGRIGNFARLVPVFTHPPRREWRGLTEEERRECRVSPFVVENYLAIEARLKEKNHE